MPHLVGPFDAGEERIRLWPEGALVHPGPLPELIVTENGGAFGTPNRAVRGIADPWMTVFRPDEANGMAVLLAPGGAYFNVMVDNEGYECARLLAARGFHVFTLFYRLPGEGWADRARVPLADAQRAMRLVRAAAADYGFDPERIASMGFSAGGHLCASLAQRFDEPVYPPLDAADALSARPWLAAPIYPVVSMRAECRHPICHLLLLGEGDDAAAADAASAERRARADAPPHFLVHAEDDREVSPAHSLMLRDALLAKGVPVATHLFAQGGHGFGVRRIAGEALAAWPDLLVAWIAAAHRAASVGDQGQRAGAS